MQVLGHPLQISVCGYMSLLFPSISIHILDSIARWIASENRSNELKMINFLVISNIISEIFRKNFESLIFLASGRVFHIEKPRVINILFQQKVCVFRKLVYLMNSDCSFLFLCYYKSKPCDVRLLHKLNFWRVESNAPVGKIHENNACDNYPIEMILHVFFL